MAKDVEHIEITNLETGVVKDDKTDYVGEVQIETSQISILDPNNVSDEAFAIASEFFGVEIAKQRDLMYVRFKLVHANTNKNGDKFLPEELQAAANTPVHKLINWGHAEPNIGVIIASKYVPGEDSEDDYLECIGAISKLRYPEYAKTIIDRYNDKKLYFSMETWFKDYDEIEASTTPIQDIFKTGLTKAVRVLKQLTFAGAAIVEDPADVEAAALALAAKKNSEEDITLKTYTEDEVKVMLDKARSEALQEQDYTKLQTANEALAARITELETSVKELTETNTSIASEKDSLLAEKVDFDSKAAALNEELAKVNEEFEAYKLEVASKEVATNRIDDLREMGHKVVAKSDEGYAEYFEKIRKMDDTSFELLKDLLQTESTSTASANADNDEDDEDNSDGPSTPLGGLANASDHGNDNDKRETAKSALDRLFGKTKEQN